MKINYWLVAVILTALCFNCVRNTSSSRGIALTPNDSVLSVFETIDAHRWPFIMKGDTTYIWVAIEDIDTTAGLVKLGFYSATGNKYNESCFLNQQAKRLPIGNIELLDGYPTSSNISITINELPNTLISVTCDCDEPVEETFWSSVPSYRNHEDFDGFIYFQWKRLNDSLYHFDLMNHYRDSTFEHTYKLQTLDNKKAKSPPFAPYCVYYYEPITGTLYLKPSSWVFSRVEE